ncbi:MAG: AmmeMemoRadiSam system protein B [Candidatus Moranbacteria bacterium]|nr:AmmeMemoRadiSam system protein B [Candidatus Moranbacteria bacterium]
MRRLLIFGFIGLTSLIFILTAIDFWLIGYIKKSKNNFDKFHFAQHLNKDLYPEMKNEGESKEEGVLGGIISHHFITSNQMRDFFLKLKENRYETIVIIGPNHFQSGNRPILVSELPYKTPWGISYPNQDLISKLKKNQAVFSDDKAFTHEHSIASPMGFINYYQPQAEVVPIILKKSVDIQSLDKLVQSLDRHLSKNTLVIASVDFSHHLNETAALFHDELSLGVINDFDYNRIFNLEIDSPPSIYVLLKYLELRDSKKMIIEAKLNSADLLNQKTMEDVTSYLFAYFKKGSIAETENTTSMLFLGDAMFDRKIKHLIKGGKDPFEKIKGPEGNFLKGTDFNILNLEGPIGQNIECEKKTVSFSFSPAIADLLKTNRFNLINLNNNHMLDCGNPGLLQTQTILGEKGIEYLGGVQIKDNVKLRKINDKTILFLSINAIGINSEKLDQYHKQIIAHKEQSDLVVANIHWGSEYHKHASKEQQIIAHDLINQGVDLIIGHHPHVIQELEIYKNKPIFYSLGNFIFDQESPETRQALGVGFVSNKKYHRFYLFPIIIENYQPRLIDPGKSLLFCQEYLKKYEFKEGCYFSLDQY